MEGPLRYPVEIHNDDHTPYSVVVQLINEVFGFSKDDAVALTDQIHNDGKAVLGEYIYEIAETKVAEVRRINKLNDLDISVQLDTSCEGAALDEEYELTKEMLEALMEEMRKDKGDEE